MAAHTTTTGTAGEGQVHMDTTTRTSIEAQLRAWGDEYRAAWANLVAAGLGGRVATGWGGTLVPVQRSYGHQDEALVLARLAVPESILATEDGGQADTTTWHDGAPTGDSVYVERWTPQGRSFHGYVDPTTRRVVQTG